MMLILPMGGSSAPSLFVYKSGKVYLLFSVNPVQTWQSVKSCITLDTRVRVKYNWSSTQILQVLVVKYKYKYFAFSPIKYSST